MKEEPLYLRGFINSNINKILKNTKNYDKEKHLQYLIILAKNGINHGCQVTTDWRNKKIILNKEKKLNSEELIAMKWILTNKDNTLKIIDETLKNYKNKEFDSENKIKNNNYGLIKIVLNNSESKKWDIAVNEWDLSNEVIKENAESMCICGKEGIKYCYEITNIKNGNKLFPIGSSCIKKFGREDLNEKLKIKIELRRLRELIYKRKEIELNGENFSKKLLEHFFNAGVFTPDKYNNYNGQKDYEYFLKIFNKRKKENISITQAMKIKAIINKKIKPYIMKAVELN